MTFGEKRREMDITMAELRAVVLAELGPILRPLFRCAMWIATHWPVGAE
jgi:hypothetical protein